MHNITSLRNLPWPHRESAKFILNQGIQADCLITEATEAELRASFQLERENTLLYRHYHDMIASDGHTNHRQKLCKGLNLLHTNLQFNIVLLQDAVTRYRGSSALACDTPPF